jgi:hypothetical protein
MSLIFTTNQKGMSSYAGNTRRGAKARRTTNQLIGRMASPENQQKHRHKTTQDHGLPQKGDQPHASLARQDGTWAEAARASPRASNTLARLPTHHTDAKDHGYPYPFAENPHLLITCKYSSSTDNSNELVFKTLLPNQTLSDSRTDATIQLGGACGYPQTIGHESKLHGQSG